MVGTDAAGKEEKRASQLIACILMSAFMMSRAVQRKEGALEEAANLPLRQRAHQHRHYTLLIARRPPRHVWTLQDSKKLLPSRLGIARSFSGTTLVSCASFSPVCLTSCLLL